MKQQEVFKKIGGIIMELNDQFKYLEADPGKIHELELELFVANTHFLANHAEVLRKINAQEMLADPPKSHEIESDEKGEEKHFEPFIHQPEASSTEEDDQPAPHIDIASDTPSDSYSFIRQEPEIIRHELEIDESWLDDEDEITPHEDEVIPEPEKEIVAEEPGIVEDTPVKPVTVKKQPQKQDEEVLTINQKISAQLADKKTVEFTGQSITDLKSAITLNDKLLYVKDLFNGYSLAYSEAIDILNRFSSFEEAENYLKSNYSVKNNWADKPVTTAKFYELLRRRFS